MDQPANRLAKTVGMSVPDSAVPVIKSVKIENLIWAWVPKKR